MEEPFKVIIVGGSVAGLTLAHCLDRANIEYNEGASIGLWPTGGRVLDQLGIWDDVARNAEVMRCHNVLFPDGFTFRHFMLKKVYERFGYGLVFVERQRLLESLYQHLLDKSKIHLNQAVVRIQQTKNGVSVSTQDGTAYKGSLVVGADGVHSRVRAEMWRLAEAQSPGSITEREKKTLKAEYACVFGISSAITGLPVGEHANVYGDDHAVLTFHGRESVYWFMISRMDRVYAYPDVPRYTMEDAEELCGGRYVDVRIAERVCVRDLWQSRRVASMTAMEEGLFETWSFGRVVLLADAVRKMTVTMGQGANATIEDSAVLATLLDRLVHEGTTKTHATDEAIKSILAEFQALRYPRSKTIYNQTYHGVRMHTRNGIARRLTGRYIMRSQIESMTDAQSVLLAVGPVVGFIPLPERHTDGWEKYGNHSPSRKSGTHWVTWGIVPISIVLGVSLMARYRAVGR
ncbi:hypothetical protein BJX64DRAFT_276360 [Aspergillus heterothallicus]